MVWVGTQSTQYRCRGGQLWLGVSVGGPHWLAATGEGDPYDRCSEELVGSQFVGAPSLARRIRDRGLDLGLWSVDGHSAARPHEHGAVSLE